MIYMLTRFFIFLLLSLVFAEKYLKVYFLDVGQGDATYIITPNNRTLLIDGGDWDEFFNAGEEVIIPFLKRKKTSTIDFVIISHPHRDHIGGLISVLKKIDVKMVCDPGFPHPTDTYHEFLQTIHEGKSKYRIIRGKSKLYIDEDIDAVVFYPPNRFKFDDPNNNSVVLKITYGKVSFLFTGDLEQDGEMDLVNFYKHELKSTVLKSPHHGSSTSSTQKFLDSVNPRIVVISCGYRNRYGYPHTEVLRRYKRMGIKILRTDLNGTIEMTTDGENIKISMQKKSASVN